MIVAFIVSALVVWGASYAQTYLVGWVGQRALADLRLRIFRHLQTLPIGFYESLGAKPQDEWTVYRVTADALDALAKAGG